MSWAGMGMQGAGSIGSGVGTVMQGYGAKSAIQDYNAQQQQLYNAARDWDYQRFLESRGQGGQALLPMYAPSGTESSLFSNVLGNYLAQQSAAGSPAQEIAAYRSIAQAAQPGAAGATGAVNNLFSGALANQQVANIAPVIQARAQVAGAQKEGIYEGLQQRLNAIAADRARAGYVGGGSALQKNLLTGATIPALQQAATVGAQADLASASDVANIRNQNLVAQLQNVNLPVQQAYNQVALQQLPQSAAAQAQQQRLNQFNWFKMQPEAFRWNQIPNAMMTPNDLMIWGGGLSAAGQTLAGAGSTQNMLTALNQQKQPSGTQYYNPVYEG